MIFKKQSEFLKKDKKMEFFKTNPLTKTMKNLEQIQKYIAKIDQINVI